MDKFLKNSKIAEKPKPLIKDEKHIPQITPWIEKYRPKNLDEVVSQSNVVNALRNTKKTGKLQHLLLYGPPGTGKTSTILALAKELFKEDYKHRVLELNASDERGIQVVREKIKKYSQRVVQKKLDFSFQIVILDEADSMTVDAQSALRRIIEDNTKTTRFCIICNYVSKIIDPIASRCAKFRFTALPRSQQLERLRYIARNEGVNIQDNLITQLIDIAEGDLRRSINLLQSISQLDSSLLAKDIVEDICGVIPEEEVRSMLSVSRYSDPVSIMKECKSFFQKGYDIRQFIIQLNDYVAADSEIMQMDKKFIFELIMECELKLLQNATPVIQLNDLLLGIRKIYLMD